MYIYRALNIVVLGIFLFAGWLLYGYEMSGQQYLSNYRGYLRLVFVGAILAWYLFGIVRGDARANRILFFQVVGAIVTLELVLHFLKDDPPFTEDVFRHPAPYVQFTAKPGSEIPANRYMGDAQDPILINSLGFRVEETIENLDPSIKKVFVLGGSTVFNGSPLSKSIPGYLQGRLGVNYRVFNFGGVSYVSGQELGALVHYILELEPYLVISYNGSNDIVQPFNYDPRPGYPYNFMLYEKGAQIIQQKSLPDIAVLLLRRSALMTALFRRPLEDRILQRVQLRLSSGYETERWEQAVVTQYIENLDKMCTIARGGGFQYAAFLQPMAHFKKPLTAREQKKLGKQPFRDYVHRQYERARELFARRAENNDDHCIYADLSLSLQGVDEELYWDYVHTNNRGNEILAEAVYREYMN